jgi:hypothetical protein
VGAQKSFQAAVASQIMASVSTQTAGHSSLAAMMHVYCVLTNLQPTFHTMFQRARVTQAHVKVGPAAGIDGAAEPLQRHT